MLSFEELQIRILELAEKVGFKELYFLPTFGSSRGDGTPHIEISHMFYDLVVAEKGREFKRKSTDDLDELLYWVSKYIAHHLAIDYELKNRISGQDSRKLLWKKQIEFIAELNKDWAKRLEKEKSEILKKAPFNDIA